MWTAGDVWSMRDRQNRKVHQPTSLIFALGSPATTVTTVTKEVALAENEWSRLRYIDDVLSRAMAHQLGLIEAGAETPWEEATELLRKIVEPPVYEKNGGSFVTEQFQVYAELLVDFSVEGAMRKVVITGGR